ncbi:hypothetical protein OsI_32740 [Oryza sativa Indica Group]|uniref:Uncharacterized protein n=1 Tax=Oryza sativa subsp. indica TaxID=39946 RepID=B8BFQ8_ORYSI|nr:hypothetical protein OsI_32740 [Oryza sativa Indica Group]
MPELRDIMDVTLEELSEEHQQMVKAAADQFINKCLLSFAKNRSGAPFLKSDLPRVLLPGQSDFTEEEERERFSGLLYKALGEAMTNHNAAFLNSFRHIMMSIFGQHVDKPFEQIHGQLGGPTYFNVQAQVQKPHGKGNADETGGSGAKDTIVKDIVRKGKLVFKGVRQRHSAVGNPSPIRQGAALWKAFGNA